MNFNQINLEFVQNLGSPQNRLNISCAVNDFLTVNEFFWAVCAVNNLIEQLTIVETFPLTSLVKLKSLTNGNLKNGKFNQQNKRSVLTIKINRYLKIFFFNGWKEFSRQF